MIFKNNVNLTRILFFFPVVKKNLIKVCLKLKIMSLILMWKDKIKISA